MEWLEHVVRSVGHLAEVHAKNGRSRPAHRRYEHFGDVCQTRENLEGGGCHIFNFQTGYVGISGRNKKRVEANC